MLMRCVLGAVCFKWPGFHGLSLGSAHHTLKPETRMQRCRRRFGKRSWSRLFCISWKTCMNDTHQGHARTHTHTCAGRLERGAAALRDLSPQTGWPAEVTPRALTQSWQTACRRRLSPPFFLPIRLCAAVPQPRRLIFIAQRQHLPASATLYIFSL